jgi:excinuclease ABC subunit A
VKHFPLFREKKVKRHSVTNVTDFLQSFNKATKALILSPIHVISNRTCREQLNVLLKQGFSRVEFDEKTEKIDDLLKAKQIKKPKTAYIVIDRISVSDDEDTIGRISDSVQTAFYEGKGECVIKVFSDKETIIETFSNRFEADGIQFETPTVHMFSFNNPLGACPVCEGFGKTMGIDEDLVIPNKSLSVYEDAIACWKGEKMSWYKDQFIQIAYKFDFPIHRAYMDLTEAEKKIYGKGMNILKAYMLSLK